MPIHAKALARHLYANVPGLAATRFAFKEVTEIVFPKPEYAGVKLIPVGDSLIVDVGANRGHSIHAMRRFARQATFEAFEPGPAFNGLRSRFALDRKVRINNLALGSEQGRMTLYTPNYGRWECDGMTATTYAEATEWMKDPSRLARFDPSKLKVDTRTVGCRTLDSFDLDPKLIKIHAQGAEHDILLGAAETIRARRPALMVAFPQPEVTTFLQDLGYCYYRFRKGRFQRGIEKHGTFTWYLK